MSATAKEMAEEKEASSTTPLSQSSGSGSGSGNNGGEAEDPVKSPPNSPSSSTRKVSPLILFHFRSHFSLLTD